MSASAKYENNAVLTPSHAGVVSISPIVDYGPYTRTRNLHLVCDDGPAFVKAMQDVSSNRITDVTFVVTPQGIFATTDNDSKTVMMRLTLPSSVFSKFSVDGIFVMDVSMDVLKSAHPKHGSNVHFNVTWRVEEGKNELIVEFSNSFNIVGRTAVPLLDFDDHTLQQIQPQDYSYALFMYTSVILNQLDYACSTVTACGHDMNDAILAIMVHNGRLILSVSTPEQPNITMIVISQSSEQMGMSVIQSIRGAGTVMSTFKLSNIVKCLKPFNKGPLTLYIGSDMALVMEFIVLMPAGADNTKLSRDELLRAGGSVRLVCCNCSDEDYSCDELIKAADKYIDQNSANAKLALPPTSLRQHGSETDITDGPSAKQLMYADQQTDEMDGSITDGPSAKRLMY